MRKILKFLLIFRGNVENINSTAGPLPVFLNDDQIVNNKPYYS